MTPEERLKKLEELKRLKHYFKLLTYKPYPKQVLFHSMGERETALFGANRCLTPWTGIPTDRGERQISEILGEACFGVQTWVDGTRRSTTANAVFLKGIEPAFRVHLDNGEAFECSYRHRVLAYAESGGLRRERWLTVGQLTRNANALRWRRTRSGWKASYALDAHPHDLSLHPWSCNDQSSLPLARDVQSIVQSNLREDEEASRCSHTRSYRVFDRRPIADVDSRLSDLNGISQWECPSRQPIALPKFPDTRAWKQSPESRAQTVGQWQLAVLQNLPQEDMSAWLPCKPIDLVGGNRILALVEIGVQPIVDFEVPGTHNYVCSGAVHHNSGKTWAAGMATAMHLTGLYPDWWTGRRFKKAVRWGVGSETGDLLKKGPQRMLYGPMEDPGSGTVPKDLIIMPPRMNRGIPDGIDTLQVRHCGPDGEPDGTLSAAIFMSYADGRAKWASDDWDGAWLDEEPDLDIYTEALTRTNVTMGPVMLTFTPLKGMSDVVMRFVKGQPGTAMVSMPIEDALHFSQDQRQAIIDSYPEHERESRTRGVPMLGEGRIFQHSEESIKCDRFDIPEHFAVLGGMDFGIDHPFAAVKIAWDKDTDTVFITQCFRQRGLTPVGHASALRHWGKFPWAWPHDGLQRDKQSGVQLAQFYRDEGLELLSEHAQYPDKRGNGLMASIMDLNQRMESGRLKVFGHLDQWFEEYRFYHYKEGLPVKERDDLLSATRYAVMCLRYATVEKEMPKSDRYRLRPYRRHSWMAG